MASDTIPRVQLNDGNSIPILGLGTYGHVETGDREKTYQAIRWAIEAGYRHIDTAFFYENEESIGKAIRDCISEGLVTREELFVTTKLWMTFFRREHVAEGLNSSLKALGLDYVDLFLVHAPTALKYDAG